MAEPILSNAGTAIIHRTEHPRYLNFFKRAYDLTKTEISRIKNLSIGEALLKLSIDSKPFFIKVKMEEAPSKIEATQQSLKQISYGEREKVLAVLEERGKARPVPASHYILSEIEKEMLKLIAKGSVYSISECYKRLAVNDYQGNKAKTRLLKKQLIKVIKLPTLSKRGRKPQALILTEIGVVEAKNLGLKIESMLRRKGGLVHKYLIDLIAKEFRKRGNKVEIEYPIGDGKTIDLVVDDRISIEIETGESDIELNVNKMLETDFEVLFVCVNRLVKQKIEDIIKHHTATRHIIVALVGNLPKIISSFSLKEESTTASSL